MLAGGLRLSGLGLLQNTRLVIRGEGREHGLDSVEVRDRGRGCACVGLVGELSQKASDSVLVGRLRGGHGEVEGRVGEGEGGEGGGEKRARLRGMQALAIATENDGGRVSGVTVGRVHYL